MDVIYTILISAGTAVTGGFSGWFFTRKKYNTEVDHNEINNLKEAISIYHTIIEDEKERINELAKRCDKYENKIDSLEADNKQFRDRYFSLMEALCMDFTCTRRQRNINLFGNNGNTDKKENKEK